MVTHEIDLSRARWWIPKRVERDELIDSPDQPVEDFRQSFGDLRTINRLFVGTSVVIFRLSELIRSSRKETTVLDVATGSADIPRALLKWARSRGLLLHVTGVDANATILQLARDDSMGDPDLDFAQCDAMALPYTDNSFDYVLSSLTFHHFSDEEAVKALTEMNRVTRCGLIVNDLRRAYLPAALIWLVTRVLRMNRMTRHDGPLSVLRSRTVAEYQALATRSGLTAEVHKHPFWRVALVVRKRA